jgi:multidrug efflux system outer membrane protein
MRRLILYILCLLCAGCMLGPNYRRPAVDTPQAFRYEVKDAQDTVNTLWWQQFQDPVLDRLIADALTNNKTVKIAAANVEQAAGLLTQTRSQLFPQFGYGATGARQRDSERMATPVPATVPNPQTAYQLIASASWEIDLWGRIRRLTEAAQASLLATEEARRGVILSLVSSVANSYLQLRGLDEQLAISRRALDTYAESVKLFELQFKYGQVSQMNVAQARTQYETAAATIPQIENQIVQTENAISILLGRNPGSIPRGKTIYELALPAVPSGIPSQVLERRPDILLAEQNLISANALIGAARALYFPSISLTGTYGDASRDLHKLFNGPARMWNYTGTITGPLFTFGSISGQVRQAEAAGKAALLGYEATVQNAFADVENSLVARAKLTEQLAAQNRLVQASKEYEHLARLQYDGGYAPYSTVLQAQQQLFPAELTLAQNRAQVFSSFVSIYQSMGGGWVIKADSIASGAAASKATVKK